MPLGPDTFGDPSGPLLRHLSDAGILPPGARLAPLSGGRTNLLWRVSDGGDGLVVKLYGKPAGNPLFGNDPAAEARMLTLLADSGLSPRLSARLDTPLGAVLVYGHVAGATWRADPESVAAALARLHVLPPPSDLPLAPDGSAALTRQTGTILSLCRDPAAARLRALEPPGKVPPSRIRALLHGDTVPGNIILGASGITLIDWQCPALGDPVHDLAIFLSPAMQRVYRGSPLTAAETSAFLAAHDDRETARRYRALAPWFHWRMAAYCLWRAENGAADYRRALREELDALEAVAR